MKKKQKKDAGGRRSEPRLRADRGEWIYGRRPVSEVLKAGVRHIYEAVLPLERPHKQDMPAIRQALQAGNIPCRFAGRDDLDEICNGGNHQGVALRTGGFPYISFDQIIHDVKKNPDALVIILDHIEDPQNTGSILRTAETAGVTGIVMPENRSAGITPAVVRASAGASEYMRVARVVNLTRSVKNLQNAGCWVTALDMGKNTRNYTDIDFNGRIALVVGSEGNGVSRLVLETSDFAASLPMAGRIASLNAAVAAAVVMYEVGRQRREKTEFRQ
ncbi:MAG: 23S rRNA (guanosine(2251)-2'-O)-methyltransferase RlmB [Kiritimatiellia bacterium]